MSPSGPVPPRVTLLTDFGTADGYAAAMRGVIAARAPGTAVDDAAHDLPRGDVAAAAAALRRFWTEYPAGTIHVVVVDPGVGGGRRALLVQSAGRVGIGPDNGVLTPMLESAELEEVREIRDPALFRHPVSDTFHGRDVFAPVAAYLAAGGLVARVGPVCPDPVRIARPAPARSGALVHGFVTGVDRFGNLATSLPATEAGPGVTVVIDGRDAGPVRRTYRDADVGALLALVGSDGCIEIAVRDGSAAARLGAAAGARVELRPGATDD